MFLLDPSGNALEFKAFADRFMAGGPMVFDGAPRPGARVENRGTITVRERGLTPPDLGSAFVGDSPEFRQMLGQIDRVAATGSSVNCCGCTPCFRSTTSRTTRGWFWPTRTPAMNGSSGRILPSSSRSVGLSSS